MYCCQNEIENAKMNKVLVLTNDHLIELLVCATELLLGVLRG